MTRAEAIAQRPSSTGSYIAQFIIGVLFTAFTIAAWIDSKHFRESGLLAPLFLLAFGITTLAQSAERLWSPITAAQRATRMSENTRLWLERIGNFGGFFGLIIAVTGSCAHAFGAHEPIFSDMTVVGWLLYFLRFSLAELRGAKLNPTARERMTIAAGQPIDWKQWNPIRSDRWGEGKSQ